MHLKGMALLTTVGSMNYNVLRNILAQGRVLELQRGAEIGVLFGDTSDYLLQEFPSLTLYSVDPYVIYGTDDINGMSQEKLNAYEHIAREKLLRYRDRSKIVKKFSLEAAAELPDSSLDFVFIDANHTYEAVQEDIRAWAPKVRTGGIVSGHDYKSFPGVTQAVDEYTSEIKTQSFYTPISSDLWFFVKP